jgi:phosphatidyl-myo-inositol dimannoside synthase
MPNDTLHILLSQRFLPEHGGSIWWMYQVYRRWPAPVRVITHDYYGAPIRTPEFPNAPPRPASGDDVTDANLQMNRRDIFLRDWGMERPGRVLRYLRMTAAVRGYLARHKGPVRIHCTHAVPEVVSLIPLRRLYGRRMRVICYAHGEEITACRSSRQLSWLMGRAHRAVDLMLANSRNTAQLLEGLIDPARVRVVHPGVDLSDFDQAEHDGAAWRKERGLEGKLVVATLGRLDPRKNQAAVVEAVARLASRFPQLTYIIAGQGRQSEALRALAAQRGVADRVTFLGPQDRRGKAALMGGCDVFAMPAIRDGTDVEGFGMVFLEAGACSKPSLAGRDGGQAEAVLDGQTGLVVDGNDLDAVTAGLGRLLEDAALRRRLGAAGRHFAVDFDWSRVVQRTVELVENME